MMCGFIERNKIARNRQDDEISDGCDFMWYASRARHEPLIELRPCPPTAVLVHDAHVTADSSFVS